MQLLKRFHLHPYLIGIFPVLSLYAHNQSQLQMSAPWRSLAVVIGGTTIVLVVLRLCFKDWARAGFITSYASLLFFLYNPLQEIAHNVHSSTINLGWNRYFLPLWILLLILGIWLVLKKLPLKEGTIQMFNLVALSTLLLPSVSIVSHLISHISIRPAQISKALEESMIGLAGDRPDIYYIILDMYGRSDLIENEFGYDNSSFLKELREQGFYVASCSTSNYSHTVLSMASALNMNFLSALGDDFVPGNKDYSNAEKIIDHNAVRQYLQKFGYSFVSFASDFPSVDIPDADLYITMSEFEKKEDIQPFELLLIEQTPIKIAIDKILMYNSKRVEAAPIRIYGVHYDQMQFILEQLTQLPRTVPGPKFVYAHLIVPHPPYVFGAHGEYVGNDGRLNGGPNHAPVDVAAYHLGYTNQLRYINSVLPDILNQIILRSNTPPIIIVQGDHGFWGNPDRRLPILNAYYLPEKDAGQFLYPDITPVNSFRVILNAYFNGQFELLPDDNYATVNDQDLYDVKWVSKDAIECNPK